MRPIFKQIKEELKAMGNEIKSLKEEINSCFRGNKEAWRLQYALKDSKYNYRHFHIARCELMGRTRDQIEKPSENNPANENYISTIKCQLVDRINEALCADEKRFVA